MLINQILESDLSLNKQNFRILEFWVYRGLRMLLLPFGRKLSVKIAVRLHWIFRHLAIAVSSNEYGTDFLNSRSAIIQGNFLKLYVSPGNSVVDVACGTARYLPILSKIGEVSYLGIDSSPIHVSRNIRDYPNVQFVLADGLQPGTIPNCDVIIASHFIEHLDKPLDFLLDIKSLCGKVIIEVPDFFADPVNIVAFRVDAPWWTDTDHRREYSERLIDALLLQSGYTILAKKFSGGTIAVVAIPNK